MLVSHRKRFIYTKTIKTGGTSVEMSFEPYCFPSGEHVFTRSRPPYESETGIVGFRGIKRASDGNVWYNHMPAAEIKARVGDAVWNSYFKFCCIRDPFDKLVSAFHFFVLPKDQCASMPFDEIKQRFRDWIFTRQFLDDWPIYTLDDTLCMDYVIRYERFQAGIEEICRRLDVPFEPEKLLHMKGEYNPKLVPFGEYFDRDTAQLAEGVYARQLELFGYRAPV